MFACGCNLLACLSPKTRLGTPIPPASLGFPVRAAADASCWQRSASGSFRPPPQGCSSSETDVSASLLAARCRPGKAPLHPGAGPCCCPVIAADARMAKEAALRGARAALGYGAGVWGFLELMSVGLGYNLYKDNSLCCFLRATYFSASFSMVGTQLRLLTGASWHPRPRRCLCVGCDPRSALLPGFSSGKPPKTQCCLPSSMGPAGRNGMSCNTISYAPANEINLQQEGNTG